MDIEQIRNDISNYGNKLFLNSAGSSLMPQSVVQKIEDYLHQEEKYGGYKVEELRENDIDKFYKEVAKLIGCKPRNVAFTHDATDAYIKALSCINFKEGDIILTTNDDYSSNNIQFISLQKRFGIEIIRIKNLKNGDLDLENFQELVSKNKPKLVAITHVPTNSGLIQNVNAIGEICKVEDILFLLDSCQSLGQLNVDVQQIHCDFLTATGRKFLRGPRGTGFLFVSDKVLNRGYYPLFIDGGGATLTKLNEFEFLQTAKRFETWEAPYALVIGFSEALQYLNNIGINNIESYNKELMMRFRNNLSSIKDVRLFDKGLHKCNILTFRKEGKSLEKIKEVFDLKNVFFSISEKKWGVVDFDKKGVDWVVRLSPHYFNTLEEIDKVSEIIKEL